MRKFFAPSLLASTLLLTGCGSSNFLSGVDPVYPIFSAERTSPKTSFFVDAYRLENGIGVPRDYQAALDRYRAAEKAGDVRATNNIGVMTMQGKGRDVSYFTAYNTFRKAANAGSANGHYNLGLMNDVVVWFQGRNLKAAELSYRIAAEQGHPQAQYRLAQLIEAGAVAPRHPNEAKQLYEMAAVNGDNEAISRLGALPAYPGTAADPAALFASDHCDCEDPSSKAMASRGALKLRELASRGDAPAQYNLAVRLMKGEASHKDLSEAARLFTLAAKGGYGPAQRQLAHMHLRGDAVGRSKVLAHAWLNLASKHGDSEAAASRYEMEVLEKSMTTSQVAEAQKMAKSGALIGR